MHGHRRKPVAIFTLAMGLYFHNKRFFPSKISVFKAIDVQFALDGRTDGLCIGAGSGSFIGSGNGLGSGNLDGSGIGMGLFIMLVLSTGNDSGNGLGSGIGLGAGN